MVLRVTVGKAEAKKSPSENLFTTTHLNQRAPNLIISGPSDSTYGFRIKCLIDYLIWTPDLDQITEATSSDAIYQILMTGNDLA